MNDFGIWTEFCRVIGYAVIKTRTNTQNHIGVVHGHVGFIGTMHAQHTNKLWIITWERTQAHQCIGYRKAQDVCKFSQLLRCIALYHATA